MKTEAAARVDPNQRSLAVETVAEAEAAFAPERTRVNLRADGRDVPGVGTAIPVAVPHYTAKGDIQPWTFVGRYAGVIGVVAVVPSVLASKVQGCRAIIGQLLGTGQSGRVYGVLHLLSATHITAHVHGQSRESPYERCQQHWCKQGNLPLCTAIRSNERPGRIPAHSSLLWADFIAHFDGAIHGDVDKAG